VESAPLIFAIIAYIAVGAMLLINIVTAIMDDLQYINAEKIDSSIVRSSFWRSVRSAFGWHVVEKLQWITLILLSNVPKSTVFLHFALYFSWLIGGVPIAFSASQNATLVGNQYIHSIGISVGNLNLNAIIFFAIFFAVTALLFITMIFPGPIGGEAGFMTNRAHYIMIRVTILLYPGIIGVSSFTINSISNHSFTGGSEVASLILAFVLVVLIGLLLPLSFFYIFGIACFEENALISKKGYFMADVRKKYGALFEIYSFKDPWICIIPVFKRSFISIFFLLLGPIIGPLVAAIISLLYVIFLIAKTNPFMDPFSRNIEVIQAILDIILFILVLIAGAVATVDLVIMGIIYIGIVFLGIIISIIGYIIATLRQQNIWSVTNL